MKFTGWLPDTHDPRDYSLDRLYGGVTFEEFPDTHSNDHLVTQGAYQQHHNSCVTNTFARADMMRRVRLGLPMTMISRMYLYWLARAEVGQERMDEGCFPRLALRAWKHFGACVESLYPNDTDPKAVPKWKHHQAGYKNRDVQWARLYTVEQTKVAISKGLPVVAGLEINGAFIGDETGTIYHRPPNPETIKARHMITLIGYDTNGFELINSWGKSWGRNGRAYISTEYVDASVKGDFYAIM